MCRPSLGRELQRAVRGDSGEKVASITLIGEGLGVAFVDFINVGEAKRLASERTCLSLGFSSLRGEKMVDNVVDGSLVDDDVLVGGGFVTSDR